MWILISKLFVIQIIFPTLNGGPTRAAPFLLFLRLPGLSCLWGDSSKMVIKRTRQNKRKIANIKEKKKEKKELHKKHKHYELKLGLTKQNNVIFIFGNWGYHLCPSKTPSVFELCSCTKEGGWPPPLITGLQLISQDVSFCKVLNNATLKAQSRLSFVNVRLPWAEH